MQIFSYRSIFFLLIPSLSYLSYIITTIVRNCYIQYCIMLIIFSNNLITTSSSLYYYSFNILLMIKIIFISFSSFNSISINIVYYNVSNSINTVIQLSIIVYYHRCCCLKFEFKILKYTYPLNY